MRPAISPLASKTGQIVQKNLTAVNFVTLTSFKTKINKLVLLVHKIHELCYVCLRITGSFRVPNFNVIGQLKLIGTGTKSWYFCVLLCTELQMI